MLEFKSIPMLIDYHAQVLLGNIPDTNKTLFLKIDCHMPLVLKDQDLIRLTCTRNEIVSDSG